MAKHNKQNRSIFLQETDDKENVALKTTLENVVGHTNHNTSVTHKDSFSNPGARTGYGQPNLLNMTEYPMTRLTQNWNLLMSLYRSSWIIQQVCSVIPEDCLTDMHLEAPKIDNESQMLIDRCIDKTNLRLQIIDAMKWARLFGGAAAIIMVDGQEEDMSLPLSVRDIVPGSFRGLFVVDRWSGIYPSLELVDNRRSPDYGLPRYYEVRDESGVIKYRVHHSRVIRFIGEQMPYYEAITEQQWGTSSIEAIYDALVGHDNVFYNIANLTFKACISVFEIDGLDQIYASASANAQRRMYSMIEAMSIMESNLGVRLVNKGDNVQQLQFSFGGLSEIMDLFMLEMAGATKIPATRLFGRAPAGMNSSGESDAKNYRLTLEQARAKSVMPALNKLLPIICMSALGKIPNGAQWKLPTLIEMQPSEKQQLVDSTENMLERMFNLNLIPADAVLEGTRTIQRDQDITTPITDAMVEKVAGKYMNDLQKQGDPFGGLSPESGAGAGGAQAAQQAGQQDEYEEMPNGDKIDSEGSLANEEKAEDGSKYVQAVDQQGNLVTFEQDKDGNTKVQGVDQNGRPYTTLTKANGVSIQKGYDEHGQPTLTKPDKFGKYVTYGTDEEGNQTVTSQDQQSGITTKQKNTPDGRTIVEKTGQDGTRVIQKKDKYGNLVVIRIMPDGSKTVQGIGPDGAPYQRMIPAQQPAIQPLQQPVPPQVQQPTDMNGNPVDQNGNPVPVDENGQPVQQQPAEQPQQAAQNAPSAQQPAQAQQPATEQQNAAQAQPDAQQQAPAQQPANAQQKDAMPFRLINDSLTWQQKKLAMKLGLEAIKRLGIKKTVKLAMLAYKLNKQKGQIANAIRAYMNTLR